MSSGKGSGKRDGTMKVRRGKPKAARNALPAHSVSNQFLNSSRSFNTKSGKSVLPFIDSIRVLELKLGPVEPVFVIKVKAEDKEWHVERTVSEIKLIAEWASSFHQASRLAVRLPTWKKSSLPNPTEIVDAVDKFLSQFPAYPDLIGSWEMLDMFEVERQFVPPSEPETGLLYLKIIGARGVIPESKKEELSGATVRVSLCTSLRQGAAATESAYAGALQSRGTESASRDPSWLHEMAISLMDKARPLWIQIFDKNKRVVAHGQLSTAGFEDGKLTKVKLLLSNVFAPPATKDTSEESAAEQGKCKVYILGQFTRMNVRQPICWNIPPIRVQLVHSEYGPGEEVRGVLILNAPEPMKADHVILTFLGRIRVDLSDMIDQSMLTSFDHSVDLFNESILCWSDTKAPLPAGFYCWPFRFRLPTNLPPTHATYYGCVEYLVRATVIRSGSLVSNKHKKVDAEVVVLSSQSLLTSNIPYEQIPRQIMKRAVFKSGTETVTVKAKLAFTPLFIGTPAYLKIIIDNESSRSLRSVVAKLMVNTTYRAPGRSTTVSELISQHQPLDDSQIIPSDSRQILKVILDVPSTTPPSLPVQLSSILEAQFVIQIQISGADGFSENGVLVATMPVLVTHQASTEQQRLKTHRSGSSSLLAPSSPNSVKSPRKMRSEDDSDNESAEATRSRSDNPLDRFLPLPSQEDYTPFPIRVPAVIKTPSNRAIELRNATASRNTVH